MHKRKIVLSCEVKILKLNSNKYTREGYIFTGWNTEADGSGLSYDDGVNISIIDNITLYAQWELEERAFAVYSATDNSLTFINDVAQTKGGTYNGKEVTEVYTGFAFGTGLDRLAMFKYNIPDIRYLYINDVRMLREFDRRDV